MVRMSGPRAHEVLEKLVKKPPTREEGHELKLRWVRNPVTGEKIDQALVCVMEKGRSYTGEEMVEIQGHGGFVAVEEILSAALIAGARVAQPGEFTMRAFCNGRMDLAQAEAVAGIIEARSRRALTLATAQLVGGLSRRIKSILDRIVMMKAELDAWIDFPEDLEEIKACEMEKGLGMAEEEMKVLNETFGRGRLARKGAKVFVWGRTNVGKSSIFNELVGESRTVVDEEPGTTRDYVEEVVEWNGVSMTLVDTAGYRKTRSKVEKNAYDAAKKMLGTADVIVCVADAQKGVVTGDEECFEMGGDAPKIAVINKIDLCKNPEEKRKGCFSEAMLVSAKEAQGIEELKEEVLNKICCSSLEMEDEVTIFEQRHADAIRKGMEALGRARMRLKEESLGELVAEEVEEAMRRLKEVTGQDVDKMVIDRIFSSFCVGK